MYDTTAQALFEGMHREQERDGPPPGFPPLPLIPVGRYTDPHFLELEQQHLWRRSWLYALHADELPRAGISLAAAPEPGWPRRVSYPTHAALEAALGQPLYPGVLLLDPVAADGFRRDWQPAGMTPERHVGYAVQWFALSLTLLVLYVVVNLKPREMP